MKATALLQAFSDAGEDSISYAELKNQMKKAAVKLYANQYNLDEDFFAFGTPLNSFRSSGAVVGEPASKCYKITRQGRINLGVLKSLHNKALPA